MTKDGSVIIAGGGIGGLASALALARAGHAVRVFEARPHLVDSARQEGAGIQIGPNGVKCLEHLGVMDSLRPAATEPEALLVFNALNGRQLAKLPLRGFMQERHGAPYWTLRRQDVHRALLEQAQNTAGIELNQAMPLSNPRATARGIVAMSVDQQIEGCALIAADGAGSRLRIDIGGDSSHVRPLGREAARAVIPRPSVGPLASNAVGLWLAPDCHVVHYPVAGGREVSIVVVARPEPVGGQVDRTDTAPADAVDQWDGTGRGESIARRLGDVTATLTRVIAAIPHWRSWPLFDNRTRYALPWTRGPMMLLGDAAHPILPYLAQGAVMALEDAVVLGRMFPPGVPPGDAFAKWSSARRMRVLQVARASHRNGLIYHQTWTAARDLAIRALPPAVQLRQFDWLYGHPVSPPT